jgi:YgiT-type zinc finger domain-containing protein
MICTICKHGETYNGETTITLEKNSSTIVFKEVPSLICSNCGESYVDSSTTKELLKTANEIIKSGVEVDIRNYQKLVA